ncbi:hypothetical protein MVEN_02308500 [Mycena venus]|uniref:Uncharacterized protein n=1 Tax=Mycena venus TaxID=2733690 RepID=A0A8H7CF10_9AGAR|nr:hypothetical protein MVEN_02308500 [Mycena venus]
MLYVAVTAGHVDARFQGLKPQAKSRIKWHENDGRAPDTRERLAAVQKLEAEFAAQNASLTDEERWLACNSAPAVPNGPPPPPNSTPPTDLMHVTQHRGQLRINLCILELQFLVATSRATVQMHQLPLFQPNGPSSFVSTLSATVTTRTLKDPSPKSSAPLTLSLGAVQYELIARVIYISGNPVGHDLTKTRLEGRTYLYNDLQRGRALNELGPLYLLEDFDAKTSYVLYLRTSKASSTSRTVEEIVADFAKIPPPSKIPIVVDDESTDKRDDEVSQMLIDSITSPTKSPVPIPQLSRLPRMPRKIGSGPRKKPRRLFPKSTNHKMIPEYSFVETYSQTACPVRCHVCGTENPDGDGIFEEIPSGECKIVLVLDPNPKAPGVLWYLAKSIKRHKHAVPDSEYEFQWLSAMMGRVRIPLTALLGYKGLAHLLEPERQERVMGVSSVLMQILAVQKELGEEFHLNGDILDDLINSCVVQCTSDGPAALA